MKVSLDSVRLLVNDVLSKNSVPESSIDIIVDSMIYADRRGLTSHGIGRLPLYVKKIRAGHFNPHDQIEYVLNDKAVAILDAHNGFGQVAAARAVETGIEKAREFGVAAVGVRNSNNFGTAGFFGNMAAQQGMAAIVCANAAPAIAPAGGNRALFGTNPICYAFPGGNEKPPVVLDMATSVVARGKVRLAATNGEKIPLTWALDENGIPTDDPKAALKGTLQPMGGVKGYGLSLFVDLFAGLLSGSAYAGQVRQLSDMEHDSGNGHLFLMIDVSKFLNYETLDTVIDGFRTTVKSCGEEGRVFLPGEHGGIQAEKRKDFIDLSQNQIEAINAAAALCGSETRLETIGEE